MSEVKELLGSHGYPAAVVRSPSLAQASANEIGAHAGFTFGLDPKKTAAQLRVLADLIDAGYALPSKVTEVTQATIEDFTMTWLNIEFAMKLAPLEEG